MTIALPEGYRLAELERDVLLAQNNGLWVVWTIDDDGELVDGHFYCRGCPGAERLARDDFEKRRGGRCRGPR